MTTKTIELELPEDGIIRQLAKAIIGGGDDTPSETKEGIEMSFDSPDGIKTSDGGLTDSEYQEMLSKFLQMSRQQQNLSPPEKIKKKLKTLKDNRQKLKFKKGFLESGGSNG